MQTRAVVLDGRRSIAQGMRLQPVALLVLHSRGTDVAPERPQQTQDPNELAESAAETTL